MESPTFAGFRRLCSQGNVVPVWREIPADCVTPVMAYLCAAGRRGASFLLESVEGGERLARYSFVGREPYRVLEARGRRLREIRGGRVERHEGDFLDRLGELFAALRPAPVEGLPRFTGGAVGYLSWDAVRQFEPLGPRRGPAALDLPDAWMGLFDTILAFDHLRHALLLIASVRTDGAASGARRLYAEAQSRLDRLGSDLARGAARSAGIRGPLRRTGRAPSRTGSRRPAPGGMKPSAYREMVRAAQDYIRAGEIYQVVLSHRMRRRLTTDPFSVYRALRRINPSPYMYFLRDGQTALAGASPEMLVRVEGGMAELHPIAGTRPRHADPRRDAALEAELTGDPKERAEHVMLVDLGRNDLGRVCVPGSVSVPELMKVERFSHVMHLVSRVTGRLEPGRTAFDVLRSVFPAGTVSGAPKVRAMEIIDELEPHARGPYAGAVCYVDHSGNLDSCIIIRTLVARGRDGYVQAGGGIVADSRPEREYQESLSKAGAVLDALGESAWIR